MKHFFLSVFLLVNGLFVPISWCQSPDEEIKVYLHGSLRDLPRLLEEDPSGKKVEEALDSSKVYDRVWLYLANSGADEGFGPDVERDRRIAVVEALLDEHQPVLLDTFRGQLNSGGSSGRVFNLLEYTRVTPLLKASLKEITASHANKRSVVQAYDLIFRHEIEDEEDRVAVMSRIQKHMDRTTEAFVAQELLRKAATVWGLEEMKGVYQNWLSLAYTKENVPAGRALPTLAGLYGRAANGLKVFGKEGADLLPLLNQRLMELVEAQDEHSKNAAMLIRQAIDVVEGRAMPKHCGNRKARYLGVSRTVMPAWKAANPKPAPAEKPLPPSITSTPSHVPHPSPSPTRSPLDRSLTQSQAPQSTQADSTLWPLLTVLLMLTAGLFWLYLKRK